MAALSGPALREAAHVVRQPFDVEGRVLHVVADVVGPRPRVFDTLLEAAVGPFVRAGVVDGLPVLEQLDRAVDPLWLRRLRREYGNRERDSATHEARRNPALGSPRRVIRNPH